jgi:hypothetical protein
MKTAAPAGLVRGVGAPRLPAFSCSTKQQQRRVVMRFKTDDPPVYQQESIPHKAKDTKLTEEQLQEVRAWHSGCWHFFKALAATAAAGHTVHSFTASFIVCTLPATDRCAALTTQCIHKTLC